jgi:hypothetical protein
MSIYAANPGGLPHVSLWLVELANKSLQTRNGAGEHCPFFGGHACSNRIAIAARFRSQCADENSALERVCRYGFRLCSDTASGLFLRPAALGLLLRVPRAFGVTVPPKTSLRITAKNPVQTSFGGPSQKADRRPWESGPLRSMVPRSRSGNSQTETLSCTRTK